MPSRPPSRPIPTAIRRTTLYFNTDNLGSIAVITDESGTVLERDSYDAWGQRRLPTGADGTPAPSQTTRGFTGQEELDFGLVHLNGRVYDPLVGRMMSADPYVPDPLNGQAWNRYSYVINNPLAFTDPSGYSWLSTFLDRSFGVLFRESPILGDLFEIAAVALCFGNPVCIIPTAFASTAFVAGVTSGNLGYALRAGLIAGVTAIVSSAVGQAVSGIASPAADAFPADARAQTVLPDINVIAPEPRVPPPPSGLPGVGGEPGSCFWCTTVGPSVGVGAGVAAVNALTGVIPAAVLPGGVQYRAFPLNPVTSGLTGVNLMASPSERTFQSIQAKHSSATNRTFATSMFYDPLIKDSGTFFDSIWAPAMSVDPAQVVPYKFLSPYATGTYDIISNLGYPIGTDLFGIPTTIVDIRIEVYRFLGFGLGITTGAFPYTAPTLIPGPNP